MLRCVAILVRVCVHDSNSGTKSLSGNKRIYRDEIHTNQNQELYLLGQNVTGIGGVYHLLNTRLSFQIHSPTSFDVLSP